jgi:hypothetical protein
MPIMWQLIQVLEKLEKGVAYKITAIPAPV